MGTFEKVEDIQVWKDSVKLSIKVIRILNTDKIPYGIKDQIYRSSISIASNIAEGYEYQNNKEFIRFLRYARGSASELKTQLIILKHTFSNEDVVNERIKECESVARQLQKLTSYLKENIKTEKPINK